MKGGWLQVSKFNAWDTNVYKHLHKSLVSAHTPYSDGSLCLLNGPNVVNGVTTYHKLLKHSNFLLHYRRNLWHIHKKKKLKFVNHVIKNSGEKYWSEYTF